PAAQRTTWWPHASGRDARDRARRLIRDPDGAGCEDNRPRLEAHRHAPGDLPRPWIEAEQQPVAVPRRPERPAARESDAAGTDGHPRRHAVRPWVDDDEPRAAQARRPDPAATRDRV